MQTASDELRYVVREAAALCGCAEPTLKKLERDGLFKARRDHRGTRWYSDRDIEALKRLLQQRAERHGLTGVRHQRIFVTSTVTGE